MKIAFAIWNNRIAPVFDTAGLIHIVQTEAGQVISITEELIPADLSPVEKAARLQELGVEALVCGAISRPLYEIIVARGIRIIPFVAGDLDEIIRAWLSGCSDWKVFAMPGCCGRRQYRFRQMGVHYREDFQMNGKRQGGTGQGAGRGQGRGSQRYGRMGGASAAGPSGSCVCPQCGQREPHQRGIPCLERKCPKCGAAMIRE